MNNDTMYWSVHPSLYIIVLITAVRAAEITVAPTSQVALLGERSQFFCEADGGIPRWVINQVQYDFNIHPDRGIVRSDFRGVGSVQQTTLDVDATVGNNNTELRCRVSEQVQSAPIFLQIQGYLDAPPNLTVTVLNSIVAHLTWAAPFTLDLPGDTDISGYNVTIQDLTSQETTLTTNTATTEYYFVNEDCSLKNYTVLIAGVNVLGLGQFGDPIMFMHGFLDFNITTAPPSQYTCETLCDDSLLVTWMINGMLLSQLANQLSVRTETDYPLQCDSGSQGSATYTSTLQVLSDTDTPLPIPYTVQCVAVATCNHGDETTFCTCYSHSVIHTEGTEDALSQLLTTATDFSTHSSTEVSPTESTILVTVSSAAGVLLIVCVCLLLCSSVLCSKMVARGKTATANTTELSVMKIEEVIYEECGGAVSTTPTAVSSSAYVTQASHHVTQAPPSPPSPTLQLCQAYEAAGQPKTDINIAYGTSGQPQTDKIIAYATTGQPQT